MTKIEKVMNSEMFKLFGELYTVLNDTERNAVAKAITACNEFKLFGESIVENVKKVEKTEASMLVYIEQSVNLFLNSLKRNLSKFNGEEIKALMTSYIKGAQLVCSMALKKVEALDSNIVDPTNLIVAIGKFQVMFNEGMSHLLTQVVERERSEK